ncbi:CTD kinase subunit beta [Sphaceloma murrayae]|uniref:CTD kinase subunit beta n=1 Tax=Sphaceloma murrayae TaxID=2082308 RepID=A0A2K1QT11_9PEZI|nr:CTD kinase subunit beta [Sphaceloma murrayae]
MSVSQPPGYTAPISSPGVSQSALSPSIDPQKAPRASSPDDVEMSLSSTPSTPGTPTSTTSMTSSHAPPSPTLPTSVSQSPLFRLPRELRHQIYLYLLSSQPLGINHPTARLDRNLTPSLLRASRPVHAETLPLLYAANKLIFSHPSDANMFSHAVANAPAVRRYTSDLILRVKNVDARAWTSYFNSNDPHRSLVQDFPALRRVTVRWRGPRYFGHLGMEDNAAAWLRDKALVEVVTSVRKCADEVWVEICVKVPDGWRGETFERALEGVVGGRRREEQPVQVQVQAEGEVRRVGGSLAWEGVWVKVETEGT